jgi:hypothetical protein
MSHASHRKAVRDASRPLAHRASHARSCANHVAARLGIDRGRLLALVRSRTGVDLNAPDDAEALMRAFVAMEALESVDSGAE